MRDVGVWTADDPAMGDTPRRLSCPRLNLGELIGLELLFEAPPRHPGNLLPRRAITHIYTRIYLYHTSTLICTYNIRIRVNIPFSFPMGHTRVR